MELTRGFMFVGDLTMAMRGLTLPIWRTGSEAAWLWASLLLKDKGNRQKIHGGGGLLPVAFFSKANNFLNI